MEREFQDILKQIGCTDGLHVPVANEENRVLQNELEEKLRCKADLIIKNEIQDEQLKRVQNQIQNLKSQKEQNQQLIVAINNQRLTEFTILKENEFNLSKTQQENRNMKKQMENCEKQQEMLQEDIRHSMKRLEHLKALVEWGEDARHAWKEEMSAGERDNNLLERFRLEDDAKFKEMELRRQKFKTDVTEREAILTKELSTLTNLENQLEQTSRLFRRAHNERMSLINYWENAVKILHQRDSNIDSILQETHELKELSHEKYTAMAEEKKFYETQCDNNAELSRQLDELNGKAVSQRRINLDLIEDTNHFKSELSTLQGVVSELGTTLSTERSLNTQLSNELIALNYRLHALHSPISDLRKKLDGLSQSDLTAAQRTKEIENILQVAEKNNSAMQTKVDKLNEKVFEKKQELDSLKETSSLLSSELKIFEMNKQAYEKRSAEIDKVVIHKEQCLYDLEMELVTSESKLARLQGERTNEEKMAYKMKILDLEEALRSKTDTLNIVIAQYNKVKNEQTRTSSEADELKAQMAQLTEKRQELMFAVEGGHKQLSALQDSNRQTQVTLNLLQLRVEQRKHTLAKTDSQVYNLEREKVELENALRDRKVEIGLQMDLMAAKKRSLEDEKSELKKALEHLNIRINQLQKKHDIVMDLLGKEEEGENFSVAHFKIKMAQEKHELQEIGDDLDLKIKKAESEIPAMENTLRVISAGNDCYKRNLDSIDSNSPEMQEKKRLEEEVTNATSNLRECQANLKSITAQIHEVEFSLSELGEHEEQVKAEWTDRDVAARSLDKELEEQQSKLARADKLLRKVKKEARAVKDLRVPIHLAEKDIDLRELQDINQSGLQQLAELGARYAEVGPQLSRYLGEKGLSLPLIRISSFARSKAHATGSVLSTHRSLLSEDSHISWGSGPSSQTPSVINLDIDTIQPGGKGGGDSKQFRTGTRKTSK